jgi:hypothetical protein
MQINLVEEMEFLSKEYLDPRDTCQITHIMLNYYLPMTVMLEFWATVSKFGASVETSHL